MVRPGGRAFFTANNRYAPLLEPQMRLWGVGYLPRPWQRRYVAWRRPDVHVYRLQLPGAREFRQWTRSAGWPSARIVPGLLAAPHVRGIGIQALLRLYNAVRDLPVIRTLLLAFGPKLAALMTRRAP